MSIGFTTGPIIGDASSPGYVQSTAPETAEWGPGLFARQLAADQIETGVDPQTGNIVGEPAPTISADALNQKYGIPGELTFTRDLPDEVGAMLYDAKRNELARQDAMARRPAGLMNSAATFGTGLIASALDPVNLAASMIPGVGEARWGIAAEQAASPLARTAIRFGAGVSAGAQAQIPLTALRYGLSQEQQADYSATDALLDVTYGSLLGGGLHATVGGLGDALGDRWRASPQAALADASLDTREAALRTAVAQLADGRPVEVQPVFDAALRQRLAQGSAIGGAVPLPSDAIDNASFGPGPGLAPGSKLALPTLPTDIDPVAESRLAVALRQAGGALDPETAAVSRMADQAKPAPASPFPLAGNDIAPVESPTPARPGSAEPAMAPAAPDSALRAPGAPMAPELMAADAAHDEAQSYARAFAQAAQCLIGG